MQSAFLALLLSPLCAFSAEIPGIITLSPTPPAPTPAAVVPENIVGVRNFGWYGLNPKLDYKGYIEWKIEPVIDVVDGRRVVLPGNADFKIFDKAVQIPKWVKDTPVFQEVPAGAVVVWGIADGKVNLVARGVEKSGEVYKPVVLGVHTLDIVGGGDKKPDEDKKKPDNDKKTDPAKTTARVQIVMVEESSIPGTNRVKFFGDEKLLAYLAEKKWPPPVVVDQNGKGGKTDVPPANIKAYIDRAKAIGSDGKPKPLPQVYLVVDEGQPDEGTVLYEGVRPATPAEMLELLKKIGG